MRFILIALFLVAALLGGLYLYSAAPDEPVADDPSAAPVAPEPNQAADEITALLDTVSGDSQQSTAESEARMAAEADTYAARLTAEIDTVRALPTPSRSISLDEINTHIDQIAYWAGLADIGSNRRLSPEQESIRQRFRAAVSEKQRTILPRLRTAYGAAISADTNGLACDTSGGGSAFIRCESHDFTREAQLRSYHSRNRHILLRLRFRQARYRSDEMRGGQFYSYDLDVARDADVIIWTDVLEHRPARD
jgi:hypothetical protein